MRNDGRARTEQAPAPIASKVKLPAKWEKGTVSTTRAVFLLVVRAAATEASRVGRMRAVIHLVLVGLAVGAFFDMLFRGALQAAYLARLRRFLGVAGFGLEVHFVRGRIVGGHLVGAG